MFITAPLTLSQGGCNIKNSLMTEGRVISALVLLCILFLWIKPGYKESKTTLNLSTQATFCIGDYITGADTGGTYELASPPGFSIPSLDANTGCFDSDDFMCPDSIYSFYYIVESPNCVGCTDTTEVFFRFPIPECLECRIRILEVAGGPITFYEVCDTILCDTLSRVDLEGMGGTNCTAIGPNGPLSVSANNFVIDIDVSGLYTFICECTPSCFDTLEYNITFEPCQDCDYRVDLESDTICPGGTGTLIADIIGTSSGNLFYEWSTGETTQSIDLSLIHISEPTRPY